MALATLMPIVASVGGNTGNQTVALVIRALALGQITPENVPRIAVKELAVATMNGLAWGALMGLFAFALYGSVALGAVMMAAIVLNLLVGALVGTVVPLLLQRAGRDPAQGRACCSLSPRTGWLLHLPGPRPRLPRPLTPGATAGQCVWHGQSRS